ncbi:hypothetical protein JCM10212_001885 [Sporobolomyces blumeae]
MALMNFYASTSTDDASTDARSKRRRVDPPRPTPTSLSLPDHSATPPLAPLQPHPATLSNHATVPPTSSTTTTNVPLKPLPAPLALLTVASSLRTAALALLPLLSKPPQSKNSNARYAKNWSDYYRLATSSIVVLRAAVSAAAQGDFNGGRIELRACAMLAEQLADVYEGTTSVAVAVDEADRVLTRALAISQSHPSFAPYHAPLVFLQVRLARLSSKPPKYTRTILKRLLASPVLTTASSASSSSSSTSAPALAPASLAAVYATHATLASLSATSYVERLTTWDTLGRLALENGDVEVAALAGLARAREALQVGDAATAFESLAPIERYLSAGGGQKDDQRKGVATSADPTEERTCRFSTAVMVEYRLIASLLAAHVGEFKRSKDLLKATHHLLDSEDAQSAAFNDGTVPVLGRNDPTTTQPSSIRFDLPTHSALYAFTYLASVAIHRDPYGKAPRSTLFVDEGIRTTKSRLEGREALTPMDRLSSVSANRTYHTLLKLHLHLFGAELAVMRSSVQEATDHVASAVAIVRDLDDDDVARPDVARYRDRLVLGLGMVRLLQDRTQEAQRCFESIVVASSTTAISSTPATTATGSTRLGGTASSVLSSSTTTTTTVKRKSGMSEDGSDSIVPLAQLSLVLLKLSQGESTVPPSSSSSSTLTSNLTTTLATPFRLPLNNNGSTTPHARANPSTSNSPLSLSSLTRSLTSHLSTLPAFPSTSSSPSPSSPSSTPSHLASLAFVASLVASLTSGEITKSKAHLSNALNWTTATGANHARALVLALLANLFEQTRNKEAFKMLTSAYRLVQNMGGRPVSVAPRSHDDEDARDARKVDVVEHEAPVTVGHARLGLWLGERLLESFKLAKDAEQVRVQTRLNDAHRTVLAREREGGNDEGGPSSSRT